MVVVGHQAVCVADPSISGYYVAERFEKGTQVIVVKEDLRACIASTCDVVQRSFVLDAKWSCHDGLV